MFRAFCSLSRQKVRSKASRYGLFLCAETDFMATGLELIAAERERQIHVEGWSEEHDDHHAKGEIASAATCYASAACGVMSSLRWGLVDGPKWAAKLGWSEDDKASARKHIEESARDPLAAHFGRNPDGSVKLPSTASWPFDASWWKPSNDPIRNLIKAGALIAAEIDRLQRLAANKSDQPA